MKNTIQTVFIMSLGLLTNLAFADKSSNNTKLFGGWELKNFVIISANGEEASFCSGLSGQILYEKTGHMSVSINCDPSDSIKVPADEYDRMLFYAGQFQIDGDKVIHKITNASSPALIGKVLVRKLDKLSDTDLVLSGALGTSGQTLRIEWKRKSTPSGSLFLDRNE